MKYGQFVGAVADILGCSVGDLVYHSAILLDPKNRDIDETHDMDLAGADLPAGEVNDWTAAVVIIIAISHVLYSEEAALRWAHNAMLLDVHRVTLALINERPLNLAVATGPVEIEASIPAESIKAIKALYAPVAKAALRAVN